VRPEAHRVVAFNSAGRPPDVEAIRQCRCRHKRTDQPDGDICLRQPDQSELDRQRNQRDRIPDLHLLRVGAGSFSLTDQHQREPNREWHLFQTPG
jgi:hypothetical protein